MCVLGDGVVMVMCVGGWGGHGDMCVLGVGWSW